MASGELLAVQATTKFKVWAPHGTKKGSWVQLKQPSLNTFILSFHANTIIIGLSSAVLKGDVQLLQSFEDERRQTFPCWLLCHKKAHEMFFNLCWFFQWNNSFIILPLSLSRFFSSSLLFFSSLGPRGLLSFWHYDRCSLINSHYQVTDACGSGCVRKDWSCVEMGWVGREQ